MGDLLHFPGAAVDWDHLDQFEWTPQLLTEYADRARELAWRYGGLTYPRLPRWPAGPPCQDCGRRTRRRVRYRRLLLCPDCGNARSRVAATLEAAA